MIKDAKTKVPVLPEEAVQEPFITSRMLQKRRLTKHGGGGRLYKRIFIQTTFTGTATGIATLSVVTGSAAIGKLL